MVIAHAPMHLWCVARGSEAVSISNQKVSLNRLKIDTTFIPSRILVLYLQTNNMQHHHISSLSTTMARGKGKKTPSKGKRKTAKEENETSSSSSSNLGPLAGVVALVILIVAIFLRPSSNETTSSYQSQDAIVENVTMETKRFQ